MSAALAQTLGERGASLDSDDNQCDEDADKLSCGARWWNKLGFPRRFQNIVTETMCESTQSHTESLYVASGDNSRSSTDVLKLSERMEIHRRDCKAMRRSRSNLQRNPVDIGLNTIISIKRSPRNSTKTERKQFHDEHGIVQRQHAPLNPKNLDLLSSLADIKRNIFSNATDKKFNTEVSSNVDVLLNFTAFEDKGAAGKTGNTDISDARGTLPGVFAIPEILVDSKPVSTASDSFSLAAHSSTPFTWDMPELPVAKPGDVQTKSSWSQSLKGLTLNTCSSSSSSEGRPIVHARVSVANETN